MRFHEDPLEPPSPGQRESSLPRHRFIPGGARDGRISSNRCVTGRTKGGESSEIIKTLIYQVYIYSQLGDYMVPATYHRIFGNQETPLTLGKVVLSNFFFRVIVVANS